MEFVKMEGLGNDFVVLEGPRHVTGSEVAAWCDRRRGIGADGVLVASPLERGRVRMDYWNADGTPAEMCGNGLRCLARLAFDRGWSSERRFLVETELGEHEVEVRPEGMVRAFLGRAEAPQEEAEVEGVRVRPVRVGNPHAVVMVDQPAAVDVAELGPRIGSDPSFPEGANVEFVAVRDRGLLEVRVWERGAGETLACGTGAAAAATVAGSLGLANGAVTVRLPGGDLLVEMMGAGVWITGPARYVFAGTWEGGDGGNPA